MFADESTTRDGQLPLPGGLPPLRLHHFLAWMAVVAIILAIEHKFSADPFEGRLKTASWWILAGLPETILKALVLTCFGFGLAWRTRRLQFPSQPGHGIVIEKTLACLLFAGGSLSLNSLPQDPADEQTILWVDRMLVWLPRAENVPVLIVFVWLVWWSRPFRRWQWFFALNALSVVELWLSSELQWALLKLPGTFPRLSSLAMGPLYFEIVRYSLHFLAGAVLLFAVWRDHRAGLRRHWSHWAGVMAWCYILLTDALLILIEARWLPLPFSSDV